MGNRVDRFMSFLVVFVVLSAWGAVTASSQTLSLDDQTATAVEDSVTFTLSIYYPSSESGEILDVTIDVDFDQTVLTYDGHTRGSLVDTWPAFDVSNPQDGQLRVAGLTFTPGGGIQPSDSGAIVRFHFTTAAMADTTLIISAQDALASFDTQDGQFTFALPPANNPPVAMDDMATTEAGNSVMVNVLGNDEDPDGDHLAITGVTQGGNGAVAITDNGASVTYMPNAGFIGSDDFTYTVNDGTDEASAMVMVTVTAPPPPANNPPVAMDDEGVTDEGEAVTLAVLANDSDVDRDSLTVTEVTQGAYGAVVINNGVTVTYTPNAGFTGEDQFMYTVSDGEAADTATVMIDVRRVDTGGDGSDGDRYRYGYGDSGGGGCTLNPGAPFDPTLIVALALSLGIHFIQRFTRRQPLR